MQHFLVKSSGDIGSWPACNRSTPWSCWVFWRSWPLCATGSPSRTCVEWSAPRFDLQHLTELRSLLFSAACRDPCFPATLFRDRVTPKGLGTSPIGVAADIVTIFNLIQMTGGAPDEAQPAQPMKAKPAPHTSTNPQSPLCKALCPHH
ncbi:hypothetical protein J4Q44_G00079560 [Coregonus suidteri]|uniref:MINAR1 N-terminal helical domain-containing protein n=1 Tax=Coregonus suidteri TaxID=861788 RepID=A0AAN8MBU7_9TELE